MWFCLFVAAVLPVAQPPATAPLTPNNAEHGKQILVSATAGTNGRDRALKTPVFFDRFCQFLNCFGVSFRKPVPG